jgi:hypothetical protein
LALCFPFGQALGFGLGAAFRLALLVVQLFLAVLASAFNRSCSWPEVYARLPVCDALSFERPVIDSL